MLVRRAIQAHTSIPREERSAAESINTHPVYGLCCGPQASERARPVVRQELGVDTEYERSLWDPVRCKHRSEIRRPSIKFGAPYHEGTGGDWCRVPLRYTRYPLHEFNHPLHTQSHIPRRDHELTVIRYVRQSICAETLPLSPDCEVVSPFHHNTFHET
jgi:hypothetical protein